MIEALDSFLSFVSEANPRFRCFPAGSRVDTGRRWIANLNHELFPPASEAELATLKSGYGTPFPNEFMELFALHNGFELYKDTRSDSAGFYAAPISEWPALEADALLWFDGVPAQEREQLLPAWLDEAVVFAEAPHSGNCFMVVIEGDLRGRIFFFDHDGFDFVEYASSLSDFLVRITTDPPLAVRHTGDPRYSDGESTIQWIPEAYATGDATL